MDNAEIIWKYLWESLGNSFGAAGLMGNLQAESALRPDNLQNSYESSLGMSDAEYVEAVDSGAYSEDDFALDRAGFGLAQWTHPERKRSLHRYACGFGKGISDIHMQLSFIMRELSSQYKSVLNTLLYARTVREASDAVMDHYEIPADMSEANHARRAALGEALYARYAPDGETAAETKSPPEARETAKAGVVMNAKAQTAAEAARSQMGGPYVFGAWGSECTPQMRRKYAGYNPVYKDNIYKACPVLSGKAKDCGGCKWKGALAFDCRGFTHWALLQAGVKIDGAGATSQWDTKSNWAERGTVESMPDLVSCVFKRREGKMSHTGLHVGGGRIIHCSTVVKEGRTTDSGWTHYAVPAGLYTDEERAMAGAVKALPVLKRGSQGSAVKNMQEMLNALGYDCGAADGIFGAKTERGVLAFQAAEGLATDGIAGEKTLTALALRSAQAGGGAAADPSAESATEPAGRKSYTATIGDLDEAAAARIRAEYPQAVIMEAIG